ncbi:hypothetical protein [Alicyclobacillus macrosporangiidus]|jgi:hypothetical protein|uniref:Uncharacterized protein n=1 Tax=Alicyclobacillus macrosporangiidus TaxID=392015 RepID=A0A1I7F2L6_9BACL|nr:hypothetical protein [Alicyclobacillus macrosporangiidus]SFU30365.1 hypothetical protein SAMN05421543_10126 [Alicyclobacillus macrosporangiidus]
MKMEAVQEQLREWGELIITTAAGESYEIHLGDTAFDVDKRLIKLSTPEAEYLIDGDAVENVKKHYGHKVDPDDVHH